MGTRTSEAIGRRIKAAREDAGLTQEELAQDIQLDRSALTTVETGGRKVSALELALIAERLDVRLEWFVEDAPAAVVSRRNAREPGAASPAIDKVTERIAREVEFVMDHDAQLASLVSPEALRRPSSRAAVEATAESARQLLEADDDEPMFDLARRVASIGLLAFSIDLGTDAADGSSILLASGGIAIVNGDRHVGRRRLTLAHELGHYLFADEFSIDWQVADPDQPDNRESKIDAFARALLLPARALERAWSDHKERDLSLREAAVITASAYRVDMATLARRMSELKLVSNGEAQEIRGARTTRADIVEFDLLIHEELSPPDLAHPYIEAVLRLYRQEVISPARALDLLFDTWDEADLPELSTLPEQAIWSFVS
jgi:Zn-dependent peptidase ImmA (M78 family)/transcriptional regulator with XRE-family HTH domain